MSRKNTAAFPVRTPLGSMEKTWSSSWSNSSRQAPRGYLWRQNVTSQFTSWQWRFFELRGHSIQYWVNEEDADSGDMPLGGVDLSAGRWEAWPVPSNNSSFIVRQANRVNRAGTPTSSGPADCQDESMV